MNSSFEPAYEVIVTVVSIQGTGIQRGEDYVHGQVSSRRVLAMLPPGKWTVDVAPFFYGLGSRPGIELAFTDRGGTHWIRRALGELEEISKSPSEHYGMYRPLELGMPREG